MKLLLILACATGFAANIPVTFQGATNTQAVLRFKCPVAACTLEVSKSPTFAPTVHDIDASLFPGSDTDNTNPEVSPAKIGNNVTWTVGLPKVQTASDGKNYSRALQALTTFYYRVKGVGSSDEGTGTFQTANIPMGSTHIEGLQADGSSGFWLQPTFGYDRAEEVIDPITGAPTMRIDIPGDYINPDSETWQSVTSGTGAGWTTPNNIAAPDSAYATYSGTTQAKLVVQTATIVNHQQNNIVWVAIKMTGFGNGGTTATRTIQICLSTNGTTCVGTTNDLILPSSAGDVYYNQSLVVGDIMGWPWPLVSDVTAGSLKLLVWKKATSGSDTISLDNAQVYWGQSNFGEESSGGFHQVCGRKTSDGWQICMMTSGNYAINLDTGTSRYLGWNYFSNAAIPGLRSEGVGACGTFGGASQLWDATNPRVLYCNAILEDGSPTLVKFSLPDPATAVPNVGTGWFKYDSALILIPSTSTIDALIQSYDSTIPPAATQFDVVQGGYVIGSSRTGQQNSYTYSIVFSLGNGTAMNDASCGSIVLGRCTSSGVGLTAINIIYKTPLCRWCGLHTTLDNGPSPYVSLEPGAVQSTTPAAADAASWATSGTFFYGIWPPSSTFTNSLNATDTAVTLTSAWDNSVHSQSGTVTSAVNNFGNSSITGTGTSFASAVTKGDTVCFTGGQCRVVVDIADNTSMQVRPPLSPEVTGASWTSQWPAQPADFATGQPVGKRYPRWLDILKVGDFLLFGQGHPWGTVTITTTSVPSDTLNGTGTTFLSNIGPGDKVCVYNNCGVAGTVNDDTSVTMSTPFGFDDGGANPYTVGLELAKITAVTDAAHIVIGRNCSLIYPQACSGTGIAHPAGSPSSILSPQGGSIADVQNGSGAAFFWDHAADPNAIDTNIDDQPNVGLHPTIRTIQPWGLNGNHETSRGSVHTVAGIGTMVSANGLTDRATITLPSNYIFTDYYPFAGVYSPSEGVTYQQHPANNHAAYCASNATNFYFCLFYMDGRPLIGGISGAATRIETNVYKIPKANTAATDRPEARINPKRLPTLAICAVNPLQNISGPSSHLVNSATAFQACTANVAGECRNSGDVGGASVAGDSFVNCPGVTNLTCYASEQFDLTQKDVCIGNQMFTGNSTTRSNLRITSDPTIVINEQARRIQVMRKMGELARQTSQYSNCKPTEDGRWCLAGSVLNTGKSILLLKLPPVPMLDSIDRSNFSFVRKTFRPPTGMGVDNVIVKFGYDSTLKCTPNYNDVCIAAIPDADNPYWFASETYTGFACSVSCEVPIPAFPARVLWSQYIYRNGSTVVSTGPISLDVVP